MSCVKTIAELRAYRDEHGLNKKDWDGYDAEPLTDSLLSMAELIEPYVPKDFELFPCSDQSVQWENSGKGEDWICIEVYIDRFYYTGPGYKDSIKIEDTVEFQDFLKEKFHVTDSVPVNVES